MRPTNRMLIRPSPRILSSAGRRGACVSRSVSTAIGSTPVRGEPQRFELAPVEFGVAERQIDATRQRRQLLPAERRQAEQPASYGAKNAAGVML